MEVFFKKNAPHLLPKLKQYRPSIHAPNLSTLAEIIRLGFGVGMLPDYLVEKDVKKGSIIRLLPDSEKLYGTLDIAYRNNRTLRQCEKLFIEQIKRKSP